MESSEPIQRFWISHSAEVDERGYTLFVCKYKGEIQTAFVFRFEGTCYAYLNKCVHMPFRLDCEKNGIFSQNRNHIKCSMHGIIYDPISGESLSPTMCTGEKLTPITVSEADNAIWVEDEYVETILNGYIPGTQEHHQ